MWSNFDISNLKSSKKLEYFAPEEKDGEKFTRISVPEVKKDTQYWHNLVVVYVLGVFPPFPVMNGYLRRISKYYSIDKTFKFREVVW